MSGALRSGPRWRLLVAAAAAAGVYLPDERCALAAAGGEGETCILYLYKNMPSWVSANEKRAPVEYAQINLRGRSYSDAHEHVSTSAVHGLRRSVRIGGRWTRARKTGCGAQGATNLPSVHPEHPAQRLLRCCPPARRVALFRAASSEVGALRHLACCCRGGVFRASAGRRASLGLKVLSYYAPRCRHHGY